MPPSQTTIDRAAELRALLRHHAHLYYVESRAEISDREYDVLYRELESIEREHPELVEEDSPTRRVGAPLPEGQGFEKVEHEVPMLSIDSLMEEDEVREFEERVLRFLNLESGDDLEWVVEPKFDGVSASLLYVEGRFVRGVTRGNGQVGEDVTANFRTIRNLPLRLSEAERPAPALLEVRGEVLMRRDAFARLNVEREERGLPVLMNPRNATSGAIRRNDPAEVARYPLELHSWSAPRCEGVEFGTHSEQFAALRQWGLPDSGYGQRATGLAACLRYHDEIEAKRFEIPFDMDGVVAKLDSFELRERMGRTARAPRWQYAHKFEALEATTTLLAIEVSVGVNGRLTPRAHVEPVEVGGVIVRHTTLHNADHVAALELHPGDQVFVKRAGDVIPQITGVAKPAKGRAPAGWKERLPEGAREAASEEGGALGPALAGVIHGWAQEFAMPDACPACGTPPVEEGKYWFCPNGLACPPQLVGRIGLVVGRSAFEIEGLGEKLIQQLIAADYLGGPADLFHLSEEQFGSMAELEGWGSKSVDNLRKQIEARREVPLARFYVALGIPEVGTATGELLSQHFDSPAALAEADEEALVALDGIGPEMAKQITGWFQDEANAALVRRFLDGGVRPVPPDPDAGPAAEGELAGKKVCVTGTLEAMSRAEAKARVQAAGGKVVSSVSGATDYLVAGEKPGSKLKKAEELGVAVLDEAAFLAALGEGG